jgi:lysophospholipase L1-like esterase
VLVALGDSYMSGEGADLYYDEDDLDHGNHCNRAPTAWAAMAGQTRRLFDSVAFLACSGARTYNVRHGGTPQYNEPATQLDQVRALKTRLGGTLEPSLVVVGLGGNDAGFATIGMTCLAPGDCSDERHLWEQNLPRVGKALSDTYEAIRSEFENAAVLVTAYPAPIYTEDGKPRKCDQVALSTADMAFVSEFVTELNATVRRAAAANRFHFLGDMEDALADAHLQLCDPENDQRPGLNFIGLRSVGGVAEQRFNPKHWYHNSLHPNERGHAAMLQVFEQWLADHPDPEKDAPAGGSPNSDARGAPEPPCDLVRDAQSTTALCDDEAARWVRGEIAGVLLWRAWGLQIAVATLAAWLLAVALFGWWRPWWPRPRSR